MAEKLHRNFQGYTTHEDCDLVAFGVSAISQVGDTYFQNNANIDSYQNALDGEELPIAKGLILNDEDVLRRAVIKQLICHFKLDYQWLEERFKIDAKHHFAAELCLLAPYVADKLVILSQTGIQVTKKGELLIRSICMLFDEYLTNPNHLVSYSKVI